MQTYMRRKATDELVGDRESVIEEVARDVDALGTILYGLALATGEDTDERAINLCSEMAFAASETLMRILDGCESSQTESGETSCEFYFHKTSELGE